MQAPNSDRRLVDRGTLWIVLAALGVGSALAWIAVGDPVYSPDAGYRVFFAERPVVKLGNRVWLPFVQVHIWLYYLSGLPVAGLKLTTIAYSALAAAFVGLYWRRVLNSAAAGLFAALCFGFNGLVYGTSALMQEPVGAALFFYFVLLASKGGPLHWSALVAGAAAMLTRDVYWIHLFAVTLVDLANRPWGSRRLAFYAVLWATPILWLTFCIPGLYLAVYGRLPEFPIEWPLMYNPAGAEPTLSQTLARLSKAFFDARAYFLGAGVLTAAALLLSRGRSGIRAAAVTTPFASAALRATPIAMLIVYGIIIAVDPWQVEGSSRMAWPFVEACFVVSPLLIRASQEAGGVLRTAVPALVALGLLLSLNPTSRGRRKIPSEQILAEHAKLERLLASSKSVPPEVCLLALERWSVFIELAAPTFRARQTYLTPDSAIPDGCEFLVVEGASGVVPSGRFEQRLQLDTGDFRWTAYVRRPADP